MDLVPDAPIRERRYAIGAIGAGFIMADVQLAAYAEAGFRVVAIASRTQANAASVAARWSISTVHATPEALIDDPAVQVLDIAFPPDQQPALIRRALAAPHIRGILAQKPLAMTYADSRALVEAAERAGKPLSVNQNMRHDQSMRALKQVLDTGKLGAPVLATIEMRAIPHWQPFLRDYDRLTLLNMSIHHLDVLRFLFGDPETIFTAVRPDPRTAFAHTDGICVSTLTFPSGLLAVSMEDVWAGPKEVAGPYIHWRVEGTEGVAKGSIGWPDYPDGSPSGFEYAAGEERQRGGWTTRWFPRAFAGVMEQLQYALATGTTPELTARDNLATMALVEAAYRSAAEHRAIRPADIMGEHE